MLLGEFAPFFNAFTNKGQDSTGKTNFGQNCDLPHQAFITLGNMLS